MLALLFMSFSFLVTWHVRVHYINLTTVLLHTCLGEKRTSWEAAKFEDSGSCMCVREFVCVRQCVTSRKLLSADLHIALFPLSRCEKQASFARQRRGKSRQMVIQYRNATCGYSERAEVLNKQSSQCYHVPAITCQRKNTKQLWKQLCFPVLKLCRSMINIW